MKKLLCVFLCFCLVMSFTACQTEDRDRDDDDNEPEFSYPRLEESPAEDFLYEASRGEITITGYVGKDREIRIPEVIDDRTVVAIGKGAFEEYDLTHITLPDTITSIGEEAFYECSCMTSIKLSKNLQVIDEFAFGRCTSLERIELPKTVENIYAGAFSFTGLTEIKLPDGLKYLGKDAFWGCESLDRLAIPDDTEVHVEYSVTSQYSYDRDLYVYMYWFESVVGGSYTYQYGESSEPIGELEEQHTVLVVSEGSYAQSQLEPYTKYGIKVEVE